MSEGAITTGFATQVGRAPSLSRALHAVMTETRAVLREHAVMLVLVSAYVIAGTLTSALYDEMPTLQFRQVFAPSLFVLGIWFAFFSVIFFAVRIKLTGRNGGVVLCQSSWNDFKQTFLSRARLRQVLGFALVLLIMPAFKQTFLHFKNILPMVRPFSWDPQLMQIDRALHFGRDPWQWLEPVFGSAAATVVLDKLYYFWFPIGIFILLWQAFSGDRETRAQFLVTYTLLWIVLGTGLAYALSSAGPCYYAGVTGLEDPFTGLMQRLHHVNALHSLTTVHIQEVLWSAYLDPAHPVRGGVSAMPSLHVAVAALYVPLGMRIHRYVAWVFAIYALLILIGSVQLGWHYASDGYLAIALTAILWKATGLGLKRIQRSART
jgi:hypothetical protein